MLIADTLSIAYYLFITYYNMHENRFRTNIWTVKEVDNISHQSPKPIFNFPIDIKRTLVGTANSQCDLLHASEAATAILLDLAAQFAAGTFGGPGSYPPESLETPGATSSNRVHLELDDEAF